MISKNRGKGFHDDDDPQYDSDDVKAEGYPSLHSSFSDEKTETTKGYISKFPFITWTLVAIVGIAFCFIHSYQDSFWQWTGDAAADAQSL